MGFKVARIITFLPQNPESRLFHVPNVKWTTLQAESMGISQDLVSVPYNDEHRMLKPAFLRLKELHGVDGLVSGVISSNYQRRIFKEVCDEIGLKFITPLWGKDPLNILRCILNENFKALIVGVYAEGLTRQWLGKEMNTDFILCLEKLSKSWGIHPCGEGGEYETFVVDAPCFKKRIRVVNYEIRWYRNWGEVTILNAELAEKRDT